MECELVSFIPLSLSLTYTGVGDSDVPFVKPNAATDEELRAIVNGPKSGKALKKALMAVSSALVLPALYFAANTVIIAKGQIGLVDDAGTPKVLLPGSHCLVGALRSLKLRVNVGADHVTFMNMLNIHRYACE
jgi:hypothetical protein